MLFTNALVILQVVLGAEPGMARRWLAEPYGPQVRKMAVGIRLGRT